MKPYLYLFAFIWGFLCSPPSYTCTEDIFEPDGSCIIANSFITDGETQTHNFCSDAEDWIRFNACSGTGFTIATSNLGSSCDTYLEIYDSNCTTLLASDDNGGSGFASLINWSAPADGLYYIRVSSVGGMFGDNYEYDITLSGDTSPCALWFVDFDGFVSNPSRGVLKETSDGGSVYLTYTGSIPQFDPRILKLDRDGDIEWQRSFSIDSWDTSSEILQTTDGGYLFVGTSSDGTAVNEDWHVVKLDASGTILWHRVLGSGTSDSAYGVVEDPGTGYIIAGNSGSFGVGNGDGWAVKISTAGAILWQRAYGHTESDLFYAVEREAGGNLLFAGSTASFGAVDTDGWIIKTDTTGVILWDRRYGGNDLDIFYSVISTTDGGYLAAGRTGSSNPEGWLVKTDASGAVVWEYSYGSSYFDMFTSAIQTHDGGYIATGTMTIAASPQEYIWLVKIDSTGTVEWQKRYAATTDMRGQSIRQMPDEGYLVGTDRGMVIRIDGQGNTGAGCSYATNTVISPSATGFGSSATTSANVPTTATVTIPGVATPASAAAIEDACPCPYATASIANISPSASECAGTELTFTGSGSGLGSLTYQWDFDYDGAIFDVDAAGSIVNHTYNPAVDTSYTVALRVTDSCSWGPARAIDTSTVDIWVATVEISGPAGICREDGALLDAGAGFISYLWSPGGETAQTINVNPYLSADYSVDVTDSEGCSGNDTHSLAVWWNPVPTIEEYGNCGDIILDAGDGYTSYLWTPGGETTQTINIGSDTGTMYSVTVTNTFGCEGSDSHQATSTCPADRYEPNDACDSRPTLLHGGDLQVHNFCDDAEDWFVFYGAAGRAYTIETFNLCPSADTVLEIYDTDCSTLLASDDNGGTGVASKLEFTAPGHGSYHIRVRNVGGASGPDLGYEISLTGDTGPAQLWFRTFDVTAVTPIDRIFWTDTAPDGGLIVAGETINQGINDYDPWIFKLDSLGSIEWERKFIADIFSATIHSVPGGFYYLTHSDGTVMKLDDAGNTVWQKRVDCTLRSADLTLDDGIIIAGNVTNNFYAARLDASGTLLWQKSYGGAGNENAMEVVATSDGGFILAGSAGSFGTAPTHMWIVKTDSTGNIQWQRVYGADVGASAGAVAETEDGGFIVGGYTWFSGGLYDQLIMKLTPDGNIQWQTVLPDSASQDSASGVLQSYDSSYIALGSAGPSGSDSYFRLTGLDGDGSFLWQRTYSDGTGYLNAFHLLEDIDTSLVVDGYTDAFGVDISAGLVMKAGSNGSIDAACSIISSDASSFVDPFLDSSATAASASVASQTISDVTYSSAAVSSTSSEHCSTCLEAAALITEVLPSASACQGVEQTFTGTGFGQGALTYQWDFDYDGFTFDVMATGTTVQYTYPASGTYTAALRVRDTCPDGVQLSVDTFSVTIHPLPTPIISGPSGICEGDPPVVLDAGTGYAAYLWSPGGQTTRTISVDPASTTLYSVTVTTAEGCQGTDDHTLNVYQVPSPTVTETCFRDDIILDAGDGYVTYLWSPGGETTQTINVGNDTTTSYSVTVTYTGGCEGSDSHTASGPCSATGDIYENDDTSYSSETIIDEGVTQTHNFLDDAIDWIHFNACTAREYLIETSNPGILADTYLELYDTDGTTLLASDDNGGGDGVSSLINWTAPADGLYHIRVRQADASSGADRSYDITLTGDTSACSAWAKSLGGAFTDGASGALEAHEGGFAVAGYKQLGESEGDVWLFKLTRDGSITWEKTYPGPNTDAAYSLERTSDGNYVLGGIYQQYPGGNYRFQAMEVSDTGTITWEKIYGNTSEQGYVIRETRDGGFVMTGYRESTGGWILKLNGSGSPSWGRTISGSGQLNDVIETDDGGFLGAGRTSAYGAGSADLFLVKLDGSGNLLWQKTYGGSQGDEAHAVAETVEGDLLIAGETASHGAGGKDAWLLKLDRAGTLHWQKTYGGTGDDLATSLTLTRDGGCAIAGESDSFGGGDKDLWALKVNSDGAITWQKRYGDTSDEGAASIQQTADGGYIISGYTDSYSAGWSDLWILKTQSDGSIDSSCSFISDTAVSAQDSTEIWAYPSFTTSSLSTSSDITTTPADSTATEDEQCNYTACLPVSSSIDTVSPSATVCQGEELTFSGSGSGDGSVTLEWDFDYDGMSFDVMDSGASVNYTYPFTGTYTAALRVTDSCANGAQDKIDTVLITIPDPSPAITGPSAICAGETAELDAGSGFASYHWTPGNMTTQTIQVSPGSATLYSVTVTDSYGCEGNDTHNLTVHPNPTPTITGPAAYCAGDPAITLDAGAGFSAYLWSPGGATTQTIDVAPAATTLYSVTVTDGNNCQGADDHLVTVSFPPGIPQDFALEAQCGKIILTWTDGNDETQYRIERDSGSGFSLLTDVPQDTILYEDTSVSDAVSYTYRVRAEGVCGNSTYSTELSESTNAAAYSAPALSADTAYCNALVFTWTDTYALENGYIIERDIDSSGSWTAIDLLPADSTFHADHDVAEGFDYSYRVSVRNLCGNSPVSNVITMTPDCTVAGATCESPSVTSVDEMISYATNWVESSSIAWNGTNFGVVWSDDRDAGEYKLIFSLMDASGNLVPDSDKIISVAELGGMPDIAWNGTQFAVVASGDAGYQGQGEQIYFFTLTADGTPTSGLVDLTTAYLYGNNFNPKVHWNGSSWGVVWDSTAWGEQEILLQLLSSSAIKLHADPYWVSSSGPGLFSGNPDITSLGGEWFIVWEEEDGIDQEIYYARRNADGTAMASSALTSDTDWNEWARVAAGESTLGLIWESNNQPFFRSFNPDGSWAGTLQPLSVFSTVVEATDIASTGAEWAVVWQQLLPFPIDTPDIYYRRIDSSGDAAGSAINVTTNQWDSWMPRISWAADRWGISCQQNVNWGNSDVYGAIVACGTVGGGAPSAPRDIGVLEFCSLLAVHWIDTSPNEDNFVLERSVDGGAFSTVATLDENSYFYLDIDVSASSTYSYRVKSANTSGDSSYTSATAPTSPDDCPIEDIAIESVTYNPDGTITFVWTDLQWQEYVDVFRGNLDGTFDIYDTIVDCDFDADTGTYTTTVSQSGATDYFYYIAPRTAGGNLFGYDSFGTERTPTGPLCP